MRRLPWWWWLYGVVLLVNGFWDWPTTFGGWAALIAEVVIILGGVATVIAWLIPATRPRVVALWRFARSLPGRFPLRIVKTSTLDALRRDSSELRRLTPPIVYKASIQIVDTAKPLTAVGRAHKLAADIDAYFAKMDAKTPQERAARRRVSYYEYEFLHGDLRELRDALGPYPDGRAPQALDRALYGDMTRKDVEGIRDALRALKET